MLSLRYCKAEVPESFRGIAVQRGGMTILRLPVSADESIKNKIYGSCTFDEDLEAKLKNGGISRIILDLLPRGLGTM